VSVRLGANQQRSERWQRKTRVRTTYDVVLVFREVHRFVRPLVAKVDIRWWEGAWSQLDPDLGRIRRQPLHAKDRGLVASVVRVVICAALGRTPKGGEVARVGLRS